MGLSSKFQITNLTTRSPSKNFLRLVKTFLRAPLACSPIFSTPAREPLQGHDVSRLLESRDGIPYVEVNDAADILDEHG